MRYVLIFLFLEASGLLCGVGNRQNTADKSIYNI